MMKNDYKKKTRKDMLVKNKWNKKKSHKTDKEMCGW